MNYWYGISGKALWKPHNRIVEIQTGIHNKVFQTDKGIEYESLSVKIHDVESGILWVPLSQLQEIDLTALDCTCGNQNPHSPNCPK
jgi:hypothetical protein